MMGGLGVLLTLIIWGIGVLILILAVRYAIDSSKTSQKLDDLVLELQLLRKELKENHNHSNNNNNNTFDTKI